MQTSLILIKALLTVIYLLDFEGKSRIRIQNYL